MVSNIYILSVSQCWFFLLIPPITDVAAFLPTITDNEVKEMARILKGTVYPDLNLRGGRGTIINTLLAVPDLKKMFDRADEMCRIVIRETANAVHATESAEAIQLSDEANNVVQGAEDVIPLTLEKESALDKVCFDW